LVNFPFQDKVVVTTILNNLFAFKIRSFSQDTRHPELVAAWEASFQQHPKDAAGDSAAI